MRPGTGSSIERKTPGPLLKAVGGKARDVGLFALGVLIVPALAAYVVIGTRGTAFFRDRW
jgi:hypothetical protein